MTDFAVIYTVSLGANKRSIFEARIKGVPEDIKAPEVTKALEGSARAAEFSEHGFFLANRKITPADKLPKGISGEPKVIDWRELSGDATIQMNLRIPGRERAAWEMAASRAGVPFRTWLRRSLADAAGIDDPTQGEK